MLSSMTGIADKVQSALMKDPRMKKADIDVSCTRGIVTLTGKVKSEEAREAAEEIARAQDGVTTVINELKVG